MLHDDVELVLKSFRHRFYVGKHPEEFVKKDPELGRWILDDFTPLIDGHIAPFYFQEPPDRILFETAQEFFKEGLLHMPFDYCMYVDHERKYWLVRDLGEQGFEVIALGAPPDKQPEAMPVLVWKYYRDGTHHCLIVADVIPREEAAQIMAEFVADTLCYTLMLSMPQFTKEQVDIPRKLNRRREKRDLPALKGYTRIYLRREISQRLDRGQVVIRPHWRRGHIRTLQDGRKIPIPATMVNWEDPVTLPKNTYEVIDN